jgi:hypothetical protein
MMQRQHQLLLLSITCIASSNAFQTPLNLSTRNNISHLPIKLSHPTQLQSASAESAENNNAAPTGTAGTSPTTFREAEVLGLRYMQDGRYEEALKGECYDCSGEFLLMKLLNHVSLCNIY